VSFNKSSETFEIHRVDAKLIYVFVILILRKRWYYAVLF